MSSLGLFLFVVGLLIVVTRGPLIFAPEGTRTLYLKIFDTVAGVRALGGLVTLLGLIAIYVGSNAIGTVADIIVIIGIWAFAVGAFWMIPFPGAMGRLGHRVINAFNQISLRLLGVLAVAIGLWIAWFGTTL